MADRFRPLPSTLAKIIANVLLASWWRRVLARLTPRPRLQGLLLCLLLVVGLVGVGAILNATYAVEQWLFPRYLRAWAFALLFNLASFVAGWRLLQFFSAAPPRLLERVVLSHAMGVLAFYLAMFTVGMLGWYGPSLFWTLPILLLGLGLPAIASEILRLRGKRARLLRQATLPQSRTELLCVVVIAVGLVAIYAQIVAPINICYDGEWYHLPIAQQYVAQGGIKRFDEGWYLGTYPHMASLFYTWAMLAPGELFDRAILCSHLEYSLLLPTLLGVAAVVRRLLPGGRHLYAGAAMFLSPSIFVYDSSFVTNADHVLMFWSSPLALGLLRLSRRYTPREALLSGSLVAAAVCTKYQSCLLVIPAGLWVAYLALRQRRLSPLFVWGSVALLVSATHWLKNVVFYHDPFYPLLHQYLPSSPFNVHAAKLLHGIYWDTNYLPEGIGWQKWRNALQSTLYFPFVHDAKWNNPGAGRSVHGMLFTLLIPALPFLRTRLRPFVLALGVLIGVIVWYLTSHQDRFLQALLPWIAAFTAAVLIQLWQMRNAIRLMVGLLVGFQVLQVAGLYFIPNHAMHGDSAVRASAEFLARPWRKEPAARLVINPAMEALTQAIPPRAKVLGHGMRLRLGFMRQTVVDETGWQGAIEYLDLSSPDRVVGLWRKLGVTHVVNQRNEYPDEADNLVREAVFSRAMAEYGTPPVVVQGWQISELGSQPRSAASQRPTRVGWLACHEGTPPGIYAPFELPNGKPQTQFDKRQLESGSLDLLTEANVVIRQSRCSQVAGLARNLAGPFQRVSERSGYQIWLRR